MGRALDTRRLGTRMRVPPARADWHRRDTDQAARRKPAPYQPLVKPTLPLSHAARLPKVRPDAHAHAIRLAQLQPAACARGAPSRGQALGLCLVLVVAGLGFWSFPLTSLTALSALGAALFAALIVFRVAAVFASRPGPTAPPVRDADLPTITVIVALYQETEVVDALVAHLMRLDYPRARRQIVLITEADDPDTTRAARRAAMHAGPGAGIHVLVAPPGQPRTKPRALNIALAATRSDLVTVYDAEDRPAPDQLRAAAAAFAAGGPRLACVQAPLSWWNCAENLLTRQFALEYAAQFHVILPALARWGWPLPLGGTSNHFRRAALAAVGGWDPYNVTEDADLGLRLCEHGYHSHVIAPGTEEEAPNTFTAWRRQRARWIKGFMQTWLVRQRASRPFAPQALKRAASVHLVLGLSVVSSFLHAPLLAWTLWSLSAHALGLETARASVPALTLLASGYVAAGLVAWVGAARAGRAGLIGHVALMPFYWPLHTVSAVLALVDLLVRPFHWRKTRHGRSRYQPRVDPAPLSPHRLNA